MRYLNLGVEILKKKVALVQIFFFIALIIFLMEVAPLLPFDGDDWRYIGAIRLPFPIWGGWNPTRVLPELLMPLGGYISAFIVYPLTHNYIFSLSIIANMIISFFIVLVGYMYYRLVRIRLKANYKLSLSLESLFLLSFFVLFKHVNGSSYYGFWTVDLACGFFYIIPGCLNASLVMFMQQKQNFNNYFANLSGERKAFFITVLYFTLLSNTQMTIILALYCSFEILLISFRMNFNVKKIYRNTRLYWSILLLWLLTILFDLNGQRAQSVSQGNEGSFFSKLINTILQFKNLVMVENRVFLLSSLVIILISFLILLRNSRNKINNYMYLSIFSLFSMSIAFVYLMLAYVKAGSFYASRVDAMWPIIYFYIFLINISIASCVRFIRGVKILLPLIISLAVFITIGCNGLYIYPNNSPYNSETIINVNNYIINQVVRADKEGRNSVKVYVPLDQKDANKKITTSNWPHSFDMAKWLQNTLYSHHIIRTRMKITFIPSKKVNRMYENKKKEQPFIPLE